VSARSSPSEDSRSLRPPAERRSPPRPRRLAGRVGGPLGGLPSIHVVAATPRAVQPGEDRTDLEPRLHGGRGCAGGSLVRRFAADAGVLPGDAVLGGVVLGGVVLERKPGGTDAPPGMPARLGGVRGAITGPFRRARPHA